MKKGLISILSILAGIAAGSIATSKVLRTAIKSKKEMEEKMISYYHLLNQWLSLSQEGKSLAEYFHNNEYKTVGIYGMKELGERLYDELSDSDVEVVCIIDKNADNMYFDMDILKPTDELPEFDVLVVTASYYFDAIETDMATKVSCPIISLEDVIYEV